MRASFVCLIAIALCALFLVQARDQWIPDQVVNQYRTIFFQNLNMISSGAIPAARATYQHDWVRDSALAMGAAQTILGKNSTQIEPYYQRYLNFVNLQFNNSPNPDCDIRADVKFEYDGSVFRGPWGRGQNDGPAGRASIRMDIADYYAARGQSDWAKSYYGADMKYGGIKWELDYVKNNWGQSTFDIWEECNAYSFYTLMVSRKTLYKGAVFAYRYGDYDYALELLFAAANINNAIPKHFNDADGMIWPMINTVCPDDRQSMDIAIQLATLHGTVDDALMKDVRGITQAWYGSMCASSNDQRCGTLKSYLDNWQYYGTAYWVQPRASHHYNLFSLWNLSQWSKANFRVGNMYPEFTETTIARYANDQYDGYGKSRGNPWLLSNFATSQVWNRAGQYFRPNATKDQYEPDYNFSPKHAHMWEDFIRATPKGVNSCPLFKNLLDTLYSGKPYVVSKANFSSCAGFLRDMFYKRADDSAMFIFQFFGYANDLTEQLHRDNGSGVGAPYLTWSYSALHYAVADRSTRHLDPL